MNWWPPRYQRGALPTELHGRMVGMPGLEPGNPEGADLQSAAVAAVPHPHFSVFKHLSAFVLRQADRIVRRLYQLVNALHPPGRIYTTKPAHPQVQALFLIANTFCSHDAEPKFVPSLTIRSKNSLVKVAIASRKGILTPRDTYNTGEHPQSILRRLQPSWCI